MFCVRIIPVAITREDEWVNRWIGPPLADRSFTNTVDYVFTRLFSARIIIIVIIITILVYVRTEIIVVVPMKINTRHLFEYAIKTRTGIALFAKFQNSNARRGGRGSSYSVNPRKR